MKSILRVLLMIEQGATWDEVYRKYQVDKKQYLRLKIIHQQILVNRKNGSCNI